MDIIVLERHPSNTKAVPSLSKRVSSVDGFESFIKRVSAAENDRQSRQKGPRQQIEEKEDEDNFLGRKLKKASPVGTNPVSERLYPRKPLSPSKETLAKTVEKPKSRPAPVIGSKLHSEAMIRINRLKENEDLEVERIKSESNVKKINRKSEALAIQRLRRTLSSIFHILSQGSDELSYDNVKTSVEGIAPAEDNCKLTALIDIFFSAAANKLSMTEAEFVTLGLAMDITTFTPGNDATGDSKTSSPTKPPSSLQIVSKSLFVIWLDDFSDLDSAVKSNQASQRLQRDLEEQCPFKPKLSCPHESDAPVDFYNKYQRTLLARESRLVELRDDVLKQQLVDCTFKPRINYKSEELAKCKLNVSHASSASSSSSSNDANAENTRGVAMYNAWMKKVELRKQALFQLNTSVAASSSSDNTTLLVQQQQQVSLPVPSSDQKPSWVIKEEEEIKSHCTFNPTIIPKYLPPQHAVMVRKLQEADHARKVVEDERQRIDDEVEKKRKNKMMMARVRRLNELTVIGRRARSLSRKRKMRAVEEEMNERPHRNASSSPNRQFNVDVIRNQTRQLPQQQQQEIDDDDDDPFQQPVNAISVSHPAKQQQQVAIETRIPRNSRSRKRQPKVVLEIELPSHINPNNGNDEEEAESASTTIQHPIYEFDNPRIVAFEIVKKYLGREDVRQQRKMQTKLKDIIGNAMVIHGVKMDVDEIVEDENDDDIVLQADHLEVSHTPESPQIRETPITKQSSPSESFTKEYIDNEMIKLKALTAQLQSSNILHGLLSDI